MKGVLSSFEITVSYSDYQKILPILDAISFRSEDVKFTDSVKITGKIKKSGFVLGKLLIT